MTAPPTGLADFRLRFNFPYLLGIMLGVNAIRDAYLLVDGPDCAFLKSQHIWGRHDLGSTLLSPTGDHRVAFTGSDGRKPAALPQLCAALTELPQAELVLLTSLPATAYPSADARHEPATAGAAPTTVDELAATDPNRRWLHVPGRSLEGDWLDGYGRMLEVLARELPLEETRPRAESVALVGYFWDRNEGDHRANVAELERLIERLGLQAASVWLAGRGRAELAAVARAGTIVSLPYGRAAARALSDRTGAQLVELDLPIGLDGTASFLRDLGAAVDRSEAASRVIAEELGAAVPRLQAIVGRFFVGRRFCLCQDPFLASALVQCVVELGGVIDRIIVPAAAAHARALRTQRWLSEAPLWCEPREGALHDAVVDARSDLNITNSELSAMLPGRSVELGFPAVHHHAVADSPFMGFCGTLRLVERLVNAQLGS